jgi:hypothetical protein
LINDQHRLLDEGNIGDKNQAHLLKGKGKLIYKEIGRSDAPVCRHTCLDHNTRVNNDEPMSTWKNQKKKTCLHCGNTGHVEKNCRKKGSDLE